MASTAAPIAYFKAVDLGAVTFEPLTKEGNLYVAHLTTPLVIQSPPTRLVTALTAEQDGEELLPYAYLHATGPFLSFLRDTEALILRSCIQNKAAWFKQPMDDDALEATFRSFFKEHSSSSAESGSVGWGSSGGDGAHAQHHIKVKVPGSVELFDGHKNEAEAGVFGEGATVRAILELTRISFGKHCFGGQWVLKQAQLAPPLPRCLIDSSLDCPPANYEEDDDDFL